MLRKGLTVGSHLAKYAVLVFVDPSLVTAAVAATAENADKIAQGAESLVSTAWDIGHDLILDSEGSSQAEALTKRIDEALDPVRKKHKQHWEVAESQLLAILGKRLPQDAEFPAILLSHDGRKLLAKIEAAHRNLVQFDNAGQKKACEEALSAWLGVLASDQSTIARLGLNLTAGIAGKVERLEPLLKERPDIAAEIARARQVYRDSEALRWLKIPQRKWRPRADSSAILKAEFAVTPLFGREVEKAAIAEWLNAGHPIAVKAVTGEGGTGKTRLLQEIVRASLVTHFAGFVSREGGEPSRDEVASLFAAAKRLGKPVFAVVDYADTQAGLVSDLLVEADRTEVRLRLVLLARNATDWKKQLSGDAAAFIPADSNSIEMALSPVGLDRDNRERFFASAVAAFAAAIGTPVPDDAVLDEASAQDSDFDNALVLSIAALARVFGDAVESAQSAFEWAIRHERDGWRRYYDKEGMPGSQQPWIDCVAIMTAVTTMSGGVQDRPSLKAIAAASLVVLGREDLSPDQMADALAALYPNGNGGAAALEPDRIGEFHVDRILRDRPEILESALALSEATGDGSVALLRFFNRARDWLGILTPQVALALCNSLPERTLEFRDLAARVTETAVEAATSEEERAGHLNNLSNRWSDLGRREEAEAAAREAVDLYRELARTRPDTFLADLAGSLNNLGNRLAGLGRREDALAATQEAADIRRELARAWPDAFLPDLAESLNDLGNRLYGLGRREDALAATQEAVDIRRELATSRPDVFLPDFVESLNNLGIRLAAVGRQEEALEISEEAVAIRRELAGSRPDAFLPNLAANLNNLGARLSAVGRPEDALAVVEEAVAIRRELAARRPDAFLPNLATNLNNLGMRLSAVGRREEALAITEEAVAIRRELAASRPAAFLPVLAESLNNLGARLSAVGRQEEALAVTEEAVAIRRELAASRPDAFLPNLATNLNNLGMRLSAVGRREEALAITEEAVAIRRELAASRPAAFLPNLATNLNNLGARLSAVGRQEEALAITEESVAIRRELAASRPEAFLPNLATNLKNLGAQLSAVGRQEEALAVTEEAVAIRRELAQTRPDAFAHDLATSINVLGDVLLALGRAAESAEAQREALTTLLPMLARHPRAFGELAMQIRREYIKACEAAGTQPDEAMLGEVVTILRDAGLIKATDSEE